MHLAGAIGIGVAAAVFGLVLFVLITRRVAAGRDLGAMSGPWIAEQRSNERTVH
jgi:hypothetical protein